jgi:hypothetical protein
LIVKASGSKGLTDPTPADVDTLTDDLQKERADNALL